MTGEVPTAKPGGIPWPTILKIVAAVVPLLAGQTVIGHYQGDAKKTEAVKESTKVTDVAYETLAAKLNAGLDEIKVLREAVAGLAIEQARSTQRDTVRRKKAKRGPVDTAMVKGAQADAAVTLKAIKETALRPSPALAPLPTTLPPVAEGAKILTPKFSVDAGKQ